MFATRSEFIIQQADASAAPGLGGLFQSAGLAVQQDSTTVQSYLKSRDAMLRLDVDQGFKAHFGQAWIDPLNRLASDASNEAAFRLYERKVKVAFDPTEGILKLEVAAADPETSAAFARALIGYAEEQVDALTRRLREDQMAGATENFAAAEARVREAQDRVLALQEDLGVLDPTSESGSLMHQVTTFEIQLREKQLELTRLLANDRPNAARVEAARADIVQLQAVVTDLRRRMTESVSGRASLRIAEAELATRQLLLQQAAEQLEAARIEANRQVRYMAVGVRPVVPDEAAYPRVLQNTLLAFAVSAGIFLMVSLTVSVLREQLTT
jgi:capsular polysaccharide transport system permease protein